jgi:Spy/CpxP family protein refolding chaperone
MKNTLTYLASLTALASGMLFGQAPAPSNPAQPPAQHRQWNRGQMFDRFATKLNLTDDQKVQAQSILKSSRESSHSVAQQLRQSRLALREAVKTGKSDAEIDQLSANVGQFTGQMTAIRTKAFAKVYALLTPEQRTKAEQMTGHARGMFMGGHGHGAGAGQ